MCWEKFVVQLKCTGCNYTKDLLWHFNQSSYWVFLSKNNLGEVTQLCSRALLFDCWIYCNCFHKIHSYCQLNKMFSLCPAGVNYCFISWQNRNFRGKFSICLCKFAYLLLFGGTFIKNTKQIAPTSNFFKENKLEIPEQL